MTARPGKSIRRLDVWSIGAIGVAALVALPLMAVLWLALEPLTSPVPLTSDDIWAHLSSTVLPHYVSTTLTLMAGVGLGTLIIGTGTAWLVTMCAFPGKRLFEWALVLPLAVPAYVIAYVYTDFLAFSGPVQHLLRHIFAWTSRQDYWFPEIRSLGGAMTMMTLVLYPYVYLLARSAFLEQSVCVLDVSRTLGKTPWQGFLRVALPLAWPAIAVGVSLVMMETLNDFGTVDYFAVATFTAGIYDVWLNMNSLGGAAQLASVMLIFVLVLITLERTARRGRRYHHTGTRYSALPSFYLSPVAQALAVAACGLPITLGFLVPAWVLSDYAIRFYAVSFTDDFVGYMVNSVTLAGVSAVLAVLAGLFLAYAVRLQNARLLRNMARFASIGYAVPGAVLAIGVILPMTGAENMLDAFSQRVFGISTGLFLSGTAGALVIAYVVRFLALSYGTVDASLNKITPGIEGAARTLGKGPGATLVRVHLPMMRASILTAAILVFVDVMKELPMTMLLRPFNFETLATYVHQFASDELLEECALGALTIVLVGILPVIILSKAIAQSRPGAMARPGTMTQPGTMPYTKTAPARPGP